MVLCHFKLALTTHPPWFFYLRSHLCSCVTETVQDKWLTVLKRVYMGATEHCLHGFYSQSSGNFYMIFNHCINLVQVKPCRVHMYVLARASFGLFWIKSHFWGTLSFLLKTKKNYLKFFNLNLTNQGYTFIKWKCSLWISKRILFLIWFLLNVLKNYWSYMKGIKYKWEMGRINTEQYLGA